MACRHVWRVYAGFISFLLHYGAYVLLTPHAYLLMCRANARRYTTANPKTWVITLWTHACNNKPATRTLWQLQALWRVLWMCWWLSDFLCVHTPSSSYTNVVVVVVVLYYPAPPAHCLASPVCSTMLHNYFIFQQLWVGECLCSGVFVCPDSYFGLAEARLHKCNLIQSTKLQWTHTHMYTEAY